MISSLSISFSAGESIRASCAAAFSVRSLSNKKIKNVAKSLIPGIHTPESRARSRISLELQAKVIRVKNLERSVWSAHPDLFLFCIVMVIVRQKAEIIGKVGLTFFYLESVG